MSDSAPQTGPKYRIRLADGAAEVYAAPDSSVLAAFERNGQGPFSRPDRQVLQIGCRSGGCGVCRVQVLSGRVRAEKMSLRHVNAAERAAGYALACRIYPESDLLVRPSPRAATATPVQVNQQ
jgi:ferredoxin